MSSAAVQQRVSAARAKALQRQNVPNHLLQGAQLDEHLQLEPAALTFAHKAAARLGWSARGTAPRWRAPLPTWQIPAPSRKPMWLKPCNTAEP
ncbi:hypothetical protein J4714_14670 [Staphylococcus epidermidis]|nr:hypothetical protein [Staphylococcus epidermidis]